MGWQADTGDGTGGAPRRVPGRPPARDLLLAGFRWGGMWDRYPPDSDLAIAVEEACGKDWSCPGASHAQLVGLLARWQALESWAAAGKLGVLRALIAEEELPLPAGQVPAGLPQEWSKSLTHEVALALGMSPVTADRLMWTAWDLQAWLPGIGQRLADGKLTLAKARAVADAFRCLSQEDVILAEELLLDRLAGQPGMTYGQLLKEAAAAAVLVNPEAAAARREGAEQDNARVTMFREDSGAAGLSGRDLPTDQTLAANARVTARAEEYKASGAFPGPRMDQLRALAYLDLLNGIPASQRIALARAAASPQAGGPDDPDDRGPDDGGPGGPGSDGRGPDGRGPDGPAPGGGPADDGRGPVDSDGTGREEPEPGGPGSGGSGCPCRQCDGRCCPPGYDDHGDSDPADPAAGWSYPDGEDHHAADGGPAADERPAGPAAPDDRAVAPRLTDLVIPLPTLLGWDQRPGESHGLGPLDPALCRSLAALATASPHTRLCITITSDDGIAIGHGCARPARNTSRPGSAVPAGTAGPPVTGLPASLNLTVTASLLAALPTAPGPPPGPGWSLTRTQDPGPPGGYGTWTLTLPDGSTRTIRLEPIPTFDCDHRHESRAYQPNDTLRHLVQIRDRTCTLPVCSRHARESDFEHAVPYDQGGRTCACNAGARSRACHQVKQAKGWTVTQPLPGWHQWETPSGRTYTQAPYQYPT